MAEAKWIRFVHSQDQIKEILDYCASKEEEARIDERKKLWGSDMVSVFKDAENTHRFPRGGS